MRLFKKLVKVAVVLICYYLCLMYCRLLRTDNRKTWLISERGDDARDNSYHLFKYVRESHPEIDIRYVIKKSSVDYEKVKGLGETIEYGSFTHYVYMITSGVLISTHIMGYTPDMSLFTRLDRLGFVVFRGKRVFLQHGVTKDFITGLLSSETKLDLLTCGAKPEYEYFLDKYKYSPSVAKYTGFARYDALVSDPKRQILLMPTFRKWLNYVENIEETEYFKRYMGLLNSKELNGLLSDSGYKLVFYPHYEIQKKLDVFTEIKKNDNIVVADFANYDVQRLLIESRLLITDYSSVFFDIAYMKKPIIYYQFDKQKYRNSHYSEGYFLYERDGFGPVVEEERLVIDYIGDYINTDFKTEEKYKNRFRDFFTLNGGSNSARIYKEIAKISED